MDFLEYEHLKSSETVFLNYFVLQIAKIKVHTKRHCLKATDLCIVPMVK